MDTRGKTVKGRLGSTFLVTSGGRVYRQEGYDYEQLPTHAGGPGGRYDVVCLDGKKNYVHRLVLTAFEGPAPKGCEASHINDNPRDNRVENLVWEPHRKNCQRRKPFDNKAKKGEASPSAKLTEKKVREILALKGSGVSACATGRRFGITDVQVGNIWKGHAWRHLSCG